MHLMIFTTGGSIDKTYSTLASDFVVGEPQIGQVLREVGVTFDYEIESLFHKDSLAITGDDRRLIVEKVRACPHRHILITHGTDTMPQTAEALMGITDKVIVLTGAMQPAAFKVTDAMFNIGCAVVAVKTLPPGVYLTMNGRIFEAGKVKKNIEANRVEETYGKI